MASLFLLLFMAVSMLEAGVLCIMSRNLSPHVVVTSVHFFLSFLWK